MKPTLNGCAFSSLWTSRSVETKKRLNTSSRLLISLGSGLIPKPRDILFRQFRVSSVLYPLHLRTGSLVVCRHSFTPTRVSLLQDKGPCDDESSPLSFLFNEEDPMALPSSSRVSPVEIDNSFIMEHPSFSSSAIPEVSPIEQNLKLQPAVTATSKRFQWDVDDDELGSSTVSEVASDLVLRSAEHEVKELLDDNFLYIPEINADSQTNPVPSTSEYVPGEPIVSPGMTRYRVDVQYQGSDFQGWFRSSTRYRIETRKKEDGTVERVAVETRASKGGVNEEGMQALHFAKTVLEEALAVAVDTSSTISVVASVIPESGVSVRRLPCHVDLPSEIEMPPRIILKRASLWLQQRKQPLAILSCQPCRNQYFHARHSGVRRVYCYRILNRIAPPLFDAGFQWHVDRHLDVSRMQRFAKEMEGTKDYGYFTDPKMANALRRAAMSVPGRVTSSFSPEHEKLKTTGLGAGERFLAPKVEFVRGLSQLDRAKALPTFNEYGQTVKTYQAKPKEFLRPRTNLPTVRTIDKIDVVRQEDEVLIWFVAQSFLRHQIRNMVSVLKAAGHGLWDEQELQHAFRSGFEPSKKKFERERLSPAPVHGLCLWDVEYPLKHREDYVDFVDAGVLEDEGVEITGI